MGSRSTPASTAWCASSCRASTNHRDDAWGQDRTLFARRIIEAVRPHAPLVGLRLSCDELAPWAGITPEMAPQIAASLVAAGVDYLVVVRGSIYSAEQTRPDFHQATGFNIDVCRAVKAAVAATPVFLQGSVVDWGQGEWALSDGVCDAVEMTRAQIADPDLVAKLSADRAESIRPCIRCNQTCQVRDVRNPIVSCVGEPSAGRETEDPDWYAPTTTPRDVVVIGGGVAGLETARVCAIRGHRVALYELRDRVGGLAAVAGPGAALADMAGGGVSPPRRRDHHRRAIDPRRRRDRAVHRIGARAPRVPDR